MTTFGERKKEVDGVESNDAAVTRNESNLVELLAAWEACCTFLILIRAVWLGKFLPIKNMLMVSNIE